MFTLMPCGLKCFPNVNESEKPQNILYPSYTPTRPSIVGIQVHLKTQCFLDEHPTWNALASNFLASKFSGQLIIKNLEVEGKKASFCPCGVSLGFLSFSALYRI